MDYIVQGTADAKASNGNVKSGGKENGSSTAHCMGKP